MQPKQVTPIPKKDKNASKNIGPHEDEELILEKQDIKKDHRNLGSKSLNIKSYIKNGLSRHTSQVGLLRSKLSSSLREIRFSNQEFTVNTPISNIKYNPPEFQNNNPFYPFYNQLDYELAKYFAKSKTTKNKVNKFLSKLLIALLTKNLFYQNANK